MSLKASNRIFDFYLLEDRILLSADGFDTVDPGMGSDVEILDTLMADMQDIGASGEQVSDTQVDGSDSFSENIPSAEAIDVPAFDPDRPLEVVFVDAGVEDADVLLSGLRDGGQGDTQWLTVHLSADEDGINQISRTLSKLSGVDAVHLISHGDGNGINLGDGRLDAQSMSGYAGAIASWSRALDENADLLIYGCDLAGTEAGRELIESIAALCDCDVAASDDATGHAALGGDWELEYQFGAIETSVFATEASQQSWAHTLSVGDVTGVWSGSGPVLASNSDADPITVTASFTAPAGSDITANTNASLTSNSFFSSAYVEGAPSLELTILWDTTPESSGSSAATDAVTSTITFTFDKAVVNPILHIDRLGGAGGSTSNSSLWTVTTAGASLTKLAGVDHLNVTSTTFYRTPNVTTTAEGEASASSSSGTAAGSIQINGTYTTLTFEVSAVGVEGAGGDGVELAWELSENSAPVLAGANDLTAINEDAVTNSGTLVSALIAGQITDDAGDSEGIAAVAVDNTFGTWEYTTDGGSNWNAFGSVGVSNARLLADDANTSVRFVPNGDFNGTISNGITFHAWDQTSGSNGGTADLNVSTNETVRDNFDAVSFSGNNGSNNWAGSWQEQGESNGASSGSVEVQATGSVIAGPYLDLEATAIGIGISRQVNLSSATSATVSFTYEQRDSSAGGQIVLEVYDGASWTTLHTYNIDSSFYTGTVGVFESYDISAYMDANTEIRFRTTGAASGDHLYIDDVQVAYTTASVGGGTSAFSTASFSSDIIVNAVNDAPVLTAYSPTYNTTEGAAPFSATVASLLQSSLSDVDSGAVEGVAVTGISGSGGTLEYTTNGTDWFAIGSVADNNALLLRSTDQFRFTPDDDNGGILYMDYRGWDQTTGTAGSQVDASTTGGVTAFSSAADQVTVNVASVNDAPTDITTSGSLTVQETVVSAGTIGATYDPGSVQPVVATLGSTDVDSGDTFTYSLVAGATNLFEIVGGNQLRVKAGATFDYESNTSHQVTVRTTDSGSATFDKVITINVADYEGSFAGTGGDDTETGTSEEDSISGGGGNDTFEGGLGADTLDGGLGTDTLSYANSNAAVSVDLATNTVSGGHAAGDTISGFENVLGSSLADAITGDSNSNVIDGGSGDDVLTGGAGNDTIIGGAGTDTVVLSGNWSDYSITFDSMTSTYTLVDLRGGSPEGTDVVTLVEEFQFADGTRVQADLINTAPSDLILTAGSQTNSQSLALVGYTGTAIVIDGATDAAWANARTYGFSGDAYNGSGISSPDDTGGSFQVLWDNNSLYFRVDILDDVTQNANPMYWQNDAVELFLDLGYEQTSAYDANDIQLIFNSVSGQVQTSGNPTWGSTVPPGITSAVVFDGANWVIEGKIDWSGLGFGISPVQGANFGLAVVAVDSDVAGQESYHGWPGGVGGINASKMLTAQFGADIDTAIAIDENVADGTVVATAFAAERQSDTVTYSLTDNAGGRFAIDGVTGVITVADGSLLNFEAASSHNVTVRATDTGGLTYDEIFTIGVNDVNEAATVVSDSATAVEAGGTANGTAGTNPTGNVLANDTDPDAGDTQTVIGVAAGTVGSASGSVGTGVAGNYGSITIGNDGTYVYTVDNNNATVQALTAPADTVTDVFTYTTQDSGGLTSTTQITVTIQGANDAPTLTASSSGTTFTEGGTAADIFSTVVIDTIESGQTVEEIVFTVANVTDGAAEQIRIDNSFVSLTNGNTGTTASSGWNYSVSFVSGTATVTVTMPGATVGEATGLIDSLAYSNSSDNPTAGNRLVTLTSIKDGGGGSDTATVSVASNVNVVPVNDAPTTGPVVLAAIAEDSGARTITQAELLSAAGDVEGDSLTATGLAISAGSGTLVDNGDGTWDYTPAADDDTSVSFSYTIGDGTDTVAGSATLDITPVNDAPTTSPVVLAAIAEDSGARTITQAELLSAAGDVEGDSLTATGLAISAGSGTLVDNGDGTWDYTPATDDDTSVSFSYTIGDGTDTVAGSATLDITPVNDAPTTSPVVLTAIAEDSGARTITQAELLSAAGDVEGDSLTATGLAISAGSGTLVDNGDGTWDYTPATDDDTSVSFSYTIGDGTDTVAGSATLVITPVNDAPTTSPVVLTSIVQDSGPRTISQAELLSAAGDIEGDALTATGLSISAGSGTLVDNGDGTWDYTPAAGDDTSVTFSYTIGDGTDTVTGSATLDITPIGNSPITPMVDSDATANQVAEDAVIGTVVGITAFAPDVDLGDTVTYSLDDDAGGRFAIDSSTGIVSVSGALDFETSASETIIIRGTSSDGSTTTMTSTISVTNVNEAPTATGESFTVNPGETLSVSVSGLIANDTDLDGDSLAIILVSGPTNGTFSLQPGGVFTYTPGAGFFGQDSFFYQVTDGSLTSNVAEVALNVPLAAFSLTQSTSSPNSTPPSTQTGESEAEDTSEPEQESSLELEPETENTSEQSESSETSTEAAIPAPSSALSTPAKESEGGAGGERLDGELPGDGLSKEQLVSIERELLGFYSASDEASGLVLSYSPELEQLERLLRQDLQQAIVWSQWEDSPEQEETSTMVFVGAAGAGVSVFSIGYVFWALRGGALMSVFASSLPAWRFIDPVAMLSAYRSTQLSSDSGLEKLLSRSE